jgi:hypothetical protein
LKKIIFRPKPVDYVIGASLRVSVLHIIKDRYKNPVALLH